MKHVKKFNENFNENNWDIKSLYQTYESEGHGYAVENYLSSVTCNEDPELAKLWNNASESLKKNLHHILNQKLMMVH